MQILSALCAEAVAEPLRRLLAIPSHSRIAFACRLGYPAAPGGYPRVRRAVAGFAHRNRYGRRDFG